ncbi:MAG: amino acid adenylation domain-containing protein [Chloroflexota bacterium]
MSIKNVQDFYPLSPMQQGMLFHSLYAPQSGVYVEQVSCKLRGDLDVSAFKRAWQQVTERHTLLRTAFVGEGLKEPVQVVHRRVDLPWEEQDWRALSEIEREAKLQLFLQQERQTGFVLSHPPLMRLALFRIDEQTYRFVWTYHHILLDGWSLPVLLQEIFAFYETLRSGRELHLDPPRPFRDYIAWLRRQDMAEAEVFWRQTLQGFTAPTPLTVDRYAGPAGDSTEVYDELEIQLSAQTLDQLRAVAQQNQLTLNTLVQGAWALLLSRYSGEEVVVFGATVSGRPPELAGSEAMVGLFINTLPVRTHAPAGATLLDWLRALQVQQVALRQYEFCSLIQIQDWSEMPAGLPLFESILVFENYPVSAALQAGVGSLTIEDVRSAEQTNYPLTVVAGADRELLLKIVYDDHRFEREVVGRMLRHLGVLLEGMVAHQHARLAELPLLTDDERQQVLVAWNQTQADYAYEMCVHELFEAVAAREPEAAAVVFGDESLTYAELNRRANRLAHYLQRLGVRPETLVGICTERSIEMIVGILGVLKAGGAYVPLDPAYPTERLAFMLEDAGVLILLTQQHLMAKLPTDKMQKICLDTDWNTMAGETRNNPKSEVTGNNLAYVIYTSGSTGKPKGVQIQHNGLLNLVHWHQKAFSVSQTDRATQIAGPGFDASVWELWPYLTLGASIHIPDEGTRASPLELQKWLVENAITISFLPTPLAESILALEWPDNVALRVLLTGGDKLNYHPLPTIPFELVNNYGPTEDTVVTTSGVVPAKTRCETAPGIGRPIANTRVYLLDSNLQPAPVGVPAELHIGGVGVGRGYLNRPELTAGRFIPDPFGDDPGARLYKSGDLARYRADGEIEFLGRMDHQVKVRGFRIELGEIEAVLHQVASVREAAVLARQDAPGDKRLVAYLVLAEGHAGVVDDLRAHIQKKLPQYMVPSAFVILERMPLTPSGKLDRRALPAPDGARVDGKRALVPPRDALELQLTLIWEDILGTRPIGVKDNFFELGGHSLLAVRLVAQVQQKLGKTLPLVALFRQPTIEHLAAVLRQEEADAGSLIVPLRAEGSAPPLFFVHPSGGSVHWYVDLARCLDSGRPFYGLQARGLNGDQALHTRIEDMAAHYVQAVRSVQPQGPYFIGSWSMGVIVAFEMAQQLEAQGQKVALLALLDQGPHVPGEEPQDQAAYLMDVFGKHLPLSLERLRQMDADQQVAHVFETAKEAEWLLPDVTLSQFQHFIRILKTHTDAWRRYVPQTYPGRVILFRASDGAEDAAGEADMGWGRFAAGGVEIRQVPGDHLSMMHEPHVQVLAEQLTACLKSEV